MLISTRDVNSTQVTYNHALLQGLAPDGGLYVPSRITALPVSIIRGKDYLHQAIEIKHVLTDSIPEKDLEKILRKAYSKFSKSVVKLNKLDKNLHYGNLSDGPSASFKDQGLQPYGAELDYILNSNTSFTAPKNYSMKGNGEQDTPMQLDISNFLINLMYGILGSTSGDTGSAAEFAVEGIPNVVIFMMSPLGQVSLFQEYQMGMLSGPNVYNLAVRTDFDGCQDLTKIIKQMDGLEKLGAVNSINWSRISSQIVYYYNLASQFNENVDFVIPTGNFGNILAGYYAREMGANINNLHLVTNENNVLEVLVNTGVYEKKNKIETSSCSMDITKASNYERLAFEFLGRDPEKLRRYMNTFELTGKVDFKDFGLSPKVFSEKGIFAHTITEKERIETIKKVYDKYNVIIDPHTANAAAVAMKLERERPTIFLGTALPVKFEDTIYKALGFIPERPEKFKDVKNVEGAFIEMDPDPQEIAKFILNTISTISR